MQEVVGELTDAIRNDADERNGYTVAGGLHGIARALHWLGTGDAGTRLGAVEFLGVAVREGLENLSAAQREGFQELREGLGGALCELADAVREQAEAIRYVGDQLERTSK